MSSLSPLFLSLITGLCVFFSIYLSFTKLYEKIWGKMSKSQVQTQKLYKNMFNSKTEKQIFKEMFSLAIGLSLLGFYLFWPGWMSFVGGLIGFSLGWNLPRIYLQKYKRKKRVDEFTTQMIDALTLMGNGLRSGLNMSQVIQIVVNEMPAPIKDEFGLVLSENKLGLTLEKALDNMAARLPSEDISMFVTSVNILRETGGNLTETFDTITKTLRERMKLNNKIKAMTAQGRTSAYIVSALPWVLCGMLFMIDPETMKPLFSTTLGYIIIICVVTLEAIGFFTILKLVDIKV